MPALPTDLADALRTVDIDPAATARLTAIYHRNLARRLAGSLSSGQTVSVETAADVAELLRYVRRLPLPLVHRAYHITDAPFDPDEVRALRAAFSAAADAPRTATVHHGADDSWARDGLHRAVAALGWDEPDAARIASVIPAEVEHALDLARCALMGAWPEAWAEHNQLIEELVFAEGPLRSATTQTTFGAVYVSVEEAYDPVRLFEVLLHETGHHALALRCQFTRFLENPDTVGSHPLRSDSRPLRGVLHAAFVLTRIADGLRRYLLAFPADGPLDDTLVRARLETNADGLDAVLEQLGDTAEWTADGVALDQSMLAAAYEIGGALR